MHGLRAAVVIALGFGPAGAVFAAPGAPPSPGEPKEIGGALPGAPAPKPPAPPTPTAAPAGSSEVAQPRFMVTADKGFFDDPMALDGGAHRLALIRTDSASFARMEIYDLEASKLEVAFDVGEASNVFEQIHFAPEGKGVVLVTRDATTGQRVAQFYDASGKGAGLAGPLTDFGSALVGGERVLVGFDRKPDPNGDVTLSSSAYRLESLSRIGKTHAQKVNKFGEVKAGDLKGLRVLGFFDGYAKVYAERAGGYDKKRDMRLPSRAAVLDTLTGKLISESDIPDVIGWARANKLRAEHPNRTTFALPTEDESALEIVDGEGKKAPATLTEPLARYELHTLHEQEGPEGGMFYFSLTIDPLNPDALRRQKRDPAFLDIYATYLLGGKVDTGRKAHIAVDERPTSWVAAFGRVAVLRRHKGFSRGGRTVEVFDLR